MYTVILLIHVMIAIALITLVLLQQGRGAEAGAAFGSGASSTVFGSRGSASFLSRITAGLATGFFLTSMTLAYFATQISVPNQSVVERTNVTVPANTDDTGSSVSGATDSADSVNNENQGPTDVPQAPSSD